MPPSSYKLEINACFVAVKLFVKRYSLIVEHTHRQRHHRRVQRRSKWLKCLLKKAVASIIKAMRKSRIKKHRPSECDGCHDTVFVSSRVTYNTLEDGVGDCGTLSSRRRCPFHQLSPRSGFPESHKTECATTVSEQRPVVASGKKVS